MLGVVVVRRGKFSLAGGAGEPECCVGTGGWLGKGCALQWGDGDLRGVSRSITGTVFFLWLVPCAPNPCAYFADKCAISFRRCDLQIVPENVAVVK